MELLAITVHTKSTYGELLSRLRFTSFLELSLISRGDPDRCCVFRPPCRAYRNLAGRRTGRNQDDVTWAQAAPCLGVRPAECDQPTY